MVVIGDIIVDDYIWGDVNRISPEARLYPCLKRLPRGAVVAAAANVALERRKSGGQRESRRRDWC